MAPPFFEKNVDCKLNGFQIYSRSRKGLAVRSEKREVLGSMLQTFKADLFKALGHPVRIRILELLRTGEQSVSQLHDALDIDISSVSQQLAVLRARQLVVGRKQGTSVYYRAVDDRIYDLLDMARLMFDQHLLLLQSMAEEDDAQHLDSSSGDSSHG